MRHLFAGVAAVALLLGSGLALWWWLEPEVIVVDGGAPGASATREGLTFTPPDEEPSGWADGGVQRLEGWVSAVESETPIGGARVEVYRGRPSLDQTARCNVCDVSAFQCLHWSTAQALAERARSGGGRPKPIAETTTDAEGHFVVEGLAASLVTVVARAPTGTGTAEWDFLPPEDGAEPGALTVPLESARTFDLEVVTEHGDETSANAPVPGARLLFWNLDTFDVVEAQADAAGRAHVALVPGNIWLETEGPGAVTEGRFWSEDTTVFVTKARVLTVRVTSAGRPVDAQVTVEGSHPESQRAQGGVVRFTQLSGTEIAVRAEVEGLIARVTDPWNGQGTDATLELVLKRSARLLVSLVDEAGNPVPNVTVLLSQNGFESASATSTELGELLSLGPLPEGDAMLTIDTPEYRHEERHLVLAPGDQPLEIVMRPLLTISGAVIDPDGKPAVRAQVSTRSSTSSSSAEASDFTDETGHFELGVEEGGAWTIDVTSPRGRGHLDVQAPARDVTVQLDALGTLDVTVVDEAGRKLEQASVVIIEQSSGGVMSTTDDGLGHVIAAGLDPGRYSVSATADGFVRAEQEVSVADHRSATVRLALARGVTIEGKVVDASGRPVPGMLLSVAEEPSGARTEEDGRFVLEGLRAGSSYEVSLDVELGPDVEAPHQKLKAPARGVIFTVPDSRQVRGHVVDAKGRPVTHFSANDVEVDAADGRFQVAVLGSTLTIFAGGYLEKSVRVGGSDEVGEIVLESSPEVAGVVLDAAGQPVAGALVSSGLAEPVVTSGDGSFRATLSSPLEGTTRFVARRGASTGAADVGPSGGPVVIRLHAPIRVHGVVYGGDGRPAAGVLVQYSNVDDADQGRVESGPDGRFELGVPQGRYTLSTRALPAAQVFELSGDEQSIVLGQMGGACQLVVETNRVLQVVALVPRGPLERASAGTSGAAEVGLFDSSSLPEGSMVMTPNQRTSTARLEGVVCGDYLLFVRGSGEETSRPVTLRPGASQPVSVAFDELTVH